MNIRFFMIKPNTRFTDHLTHTGTEITDMNHPLVNKVMSAVEAGDDWFENYDNCDVVINENFVYESAQRMGEMHEGNECSMKYSKAGLVWWAARLLAEGATTLEYCITLGLDPKDLETPTLFDGYLTIQWND